MSAVEEIAAAPTQGRAGRIRAALAATGVPGVVLAILGLLLIAAGTVTVRRARGSAAR